MNKVQSGINKIADIAQESADLKNVMDITSTLFSWSDVISICKKFEQSRLKDVIEIAKKLKREEMVFEDGFYKPSGNNKMFNKGIDEVLNLLENNLKNES